MTPEARNETRHAMLDDDPSANAPNAPRPGSNLAIRTRDPPRCLDEGHRGLPLAGQSVALARPSSVCLAIQNGVIGKG